MQRFASLSAESFVYRAALVAVFVLVSTVAAVGQSEQLSRLYAREAYVALGIDPEEAVRLADVSLSYDQENADALHARAAAHAREQRTRYRAVDDLDRAVNLGGFRETSSREAHLLLARLQVDSGRPGEALDALDRVLEADPFDADALVLQLRALRESGRLDEAFALASEADLLYPDDPRVLDELLRLDPAPGYEQLRRLEEAPRPDDGRWLRAVLYYAEHAAEDADRRRAVSLYREYGGDDPAIYLYDDSTDDEERVERFFDDGGGEDINLIQELYDQLGETGRALLEEEFEAYTGELVIDRHRRGLYEQEFMFEGGAIARWRIDEDVNGRAEMVLRFDPETGEPVSVSRGTAEEAITLRYRRYPQVAYADIGDERLFLRPGAVEYRILSSAEPWFEQRPDVFFDYALSSDTPPLSRDILLPDAYLVQRVDGDRVERATRLRNGIPVLESSDTLRDGNVDTVRYFEDGQVRRAVRDPTGDGVFSVFEEYENGVLSRTGYDSNRDGTYEFIESYENGRSVEWDTPIGEADDPGDGLVDIRYIEFDDSTSRTEFLRFLDPPVSVRIDRVWTVPRPLR